MRVVDNVGFNVKKQEIPGGGNSGGGNAQPLATPDYLQNDETAADYIKNRPFYTTDPVETELVNGTFAFQYAGDNISVSRGITIDLVEGQIYKVTMDDYFKEYETLCRSYEGSLFIGSEAYLYGESPKPPDINDDPVEFCYQVTNGNHFFATIYTESQHNITIKTDTTQIVKIPDKYLPLDDYVSKNGDTINGDLVLETAVGQNTSYAGLEKVNLSGTELACQTVGIRDIKGGDAKLAIVVMDSPMLCTLVDGEITSMLSWDSRSGDAVQLSLLNSQYKELPFVITTKTPTQDSHAANKKYVDDTVAAHVTDKKLILSSSTAGSTKKFEITVDDSGTLKATEVTG